MVPLGYTGYRLTLMAVCVLISATVFASLSGCSEPELSQGMPSAEEAAQAFVTGAVENDAALVSDAMGYEVSAEDVTRWRSEVLGVDSILEDAQPNLFEEARETGSEAVQGSGGATFLLDSIDAGGKRLSADDGSLREVVVVVMENQGWHVVLVEPIETE